MPQELLRNIRVACTANGRDERIVRSIGFDPFDIVATTRSGRPNTSPSTVR